MRARLNPPIVAELASNGQCPLRLPLYLNNRHYRHVGHTDHLDYQHPYSTDSHFLFLGSCHDSHQLCLSQNLTTCLSLIEVALTNEGVTKIKEGGACDNICDTILSDVVSQHFNYPKTQRALISQ